MQSGIINRAADVAAFGETSTQLVAAFANLAVIAAIMQASTEALADDLAQSTIHRAGKDCRDQCQLSKEAAQRYQRRFGAVVTHQMRSAAASVF